MNWNANPNSFHLYIPDELFLVMVKHAKEIAEALTPVKLPEFKPIRNRL